MKNVIGAILVLVAILCCGSAALAEGFTVSGDYSAMDYGFGDSGNHVTVTGEVQSGTFVLGGVYSMGISFDPAPFIYEDYALSFYGAYAGFTFVQNDAADLSAIVGLVGMDAEYNYDDGYDEEQALTDIGCFAVGLKGGINAGPVIISGLVLYGIGNGEAELYDYDYYGDTDSTIITDLIFEAYITYFEVRVTNQFSETVGAYVAYRGLSFRTEGPITFPDITGFCAGVLIKF